MDQVLVESGYSQICLRRVGCRNGTPSFFISPRKVLAIAFAILTLHGHVQYCSAEQVSRLPLPDSPAKILIWPAEFSHWINLRILASALAKRGHEITVLRSSAYRDFMEETEEFSFINFNVTGFKPGDHLESMDHVLHLLKLGDGKSNIFQAATGMVHFWLEQLDMRERQCNAIMTNHEILNRLSAARYDLVISDPTVFGGEIIAHKLGVPSVYAVRILPGEFQFQLSQTPMPISYVPMINTEFTDRMSFLQRTANALTYLYQTIAVDIYAKVIMDPVVQRYLGPEGGYKQLLKNASLWLVRTDFAFEYPRPLMPNVKFVGGFHCRPASPLPHELESFISESGEDGFMVFSMGSMVRNMHKSKANVIAAAFAKLKQRVIWRYLGETPDTLGPNTKIMSWLPQNDLLGHPKCKLFMTHGGTNGIYEAIYHGVPMLGLPLLVDQFDNMIRIKDRGAGKTLDVTNLNETELRITIQDLIQDSSYKDSAMRLSRLHQDKPMTALDDATYWIEYVIRHKGAYHLRPAAHDLWWFQYHLLDVIVFLISVTVGVAWLIRFTYRLARSKPGGNKPAQEEETKMKTETKQKTSSSEHISANGHVSGNGVIHRGKNGYRSPKHTNGNGHLANGFHKQTKICSYCDGSGET